jgi:hypothetical protein
MTKVIFAGTDERGGCRKPIQKMRGAPETTTGTDAMEGIQEGVNFYGPRCFEQSVSHLRREQSEQHQQQLADGAAAVVVGFEDQLRSG